MSRKNHALVFDCDGVLVNSEEIVQDIELELLAAHGLWYQRDEFSDRFLGVTNEHFIAALNSDSITQLGIPLPASFEASLASRARDEFQTRLRTFEGVERVIDAWPGHLAVASSSSVSGLKYKLRVTGLAARFAPHIYSAEHVGRGKPDPAIYLHAAQQLKVSPDHCIAIEDSINGVLSAKSAGMYTIGFTGGEHCRDGHDASLENAGADEVFSTMRDIHHHIRKL